MNILANVGIVIIIVVVPSSLTTSVELNIHRRLGEVFSGFTSVFSFLTFGLELLISLVTDFLRILTKGNSMVKITTTWGIWFFLFQASNMQIPGFGAYSWRFGKSNPQKMSTQISII